MVDEDEVTAGDPRSRDPDAELALRHAAVLELQVSLLGSKTVEGFLQNAVDRASAHVSPHAACTFTARVKGRYICVASSDEAALKADLVEYETESGPCVEAVNRGVESVVADIDTDGRWPKWAAAARELGFLSAAGIPADTGEGVRLALDLYGRQPNAFGPEEMRRARAYTEEAARTLRLCLVLAEQATLAEHLQTALASRSTIDQALGVIMGQNRVPRDEAFAILRAASQHRNVKLREVARSIIENLTGHPAAEPPEFTVRAD